MEAISVLDIFKIGVGPSSSHTMGPWRAAQRFVARLREQGVLERVTRVRTELFGSLAKTGHGHGTDLAVMLGLSGEDPVTCETEGLTERVEAMKDAGRLPLEVVGANIGRRIRFDYDQDLVFRTDRTLPEHPNALTFTAEVEGGTLVSQTYYSVGGGFVVEAGEQPSGSRMVALAHVLDVADEVSSACERMGIAIPELVKQNELSWRTESEVRSGLLRIWRVMQECMFRGCRTDGILPGGLSVVRRAKAMHDKLLGQTDSDDESSHPTPGAIQSWCWRIGSRGHSFEQILKWVATFALAVNEENAAFGRVVTAPTNGAAGVIPAVMMYAWCFVPGMNDDKIVDFMLTAGQIGILFKKGATISAAMGGCQAEIGVSSAMAAAGLTQVMGGSVGQVLMSAEIAMEHHLGMTCDPIKGLVQIPCIERNTMGAIKAITAANMAMEGNPATARVSLDDVIRTMWQTAQDMSTKYKETAEGGLALNVSVTVPEC